VAFSDTDEEVERRSGLSVEEVWGQGGEDLFRELERQIVHNLASSTDHRVVATGGGAVLSPENRTAMKGSGKVVWLSAVEPKLVERLEVSPKRPLLKGPDTVERKVAELMAERESIYAGVADASIDVSDIDEVEVAKEVEALWTQFQSV
jgi:shikimate kinase